MTYVVNDACIKCKFMDCVEVCPVDCFYEGDNMLVIHPDECIDCGVCEPECPVEAIHPDTDDFEKIHLQLEIVWQAERLRSLGCPLLFYAARKPERLARIMMASAVLHAQAEYVRTHEPSILRELLRAAGRSAS